MNGNVHHTIAPRALYNNAVHDGTAENNADGVLPPERLDDLNYNEEHVQAIPQPHVIPVDVSKDGIKKAIVYQIDFYFSEKNLASDRYLISQMDSENYVPVATIANFNKVKLLTSKIELITEALHECQNVQLSEDKQKVRPVNYQTYQHCTILLREISQDTPVEDIKELITPNGVPSCVSCEFAGNNVWYVTYTNDAEARVAYDYIRENVKEFRGNSINVAFKAKHGGNYQQSGVPPFPKSWMPAPPSERYNLMYSNAQQQYMYHNGGTHAQIPLAANPPFYYPMGPGPMVPCMTAWQPNGYYDISTVFQMNGLAPQAPHKQPFKNNQKSKKKTGQSEQTAAASSSNSSRLPPAHVASANRGTLNARGPHLQNDMPEASVPIGVSYVSHPVPLIDMAMGYGYVNQQPLAAMPKEPMPPRHRRKRREDENVAGPSQQQEVEQRAFDLGHSAFPPLKSNSRRLNNNHPSEVQETNNSEQPMTWSSHHIVDILRGNSKSGSTASSKDSASIQGEYGDNSRAGTPRLNEVIEASGDSIPTNTITPIVSPEKSQEAKCTMTDKSTKTDDVLLNGESEVCPTTTNAATMTTAAESSTATRIETSPQSTTSTNAASRMSYAQVAQQAREAAAAAAGNHKEKKDTSNDRESAQVAAVQNGEKKGKDNKQNNRQNKQDKKTEKNRPEQARNSRQYNGTTKKQRKSRKNNHS